MISKGLSDIRGIRSLNTHPGPVKENDAFRRLYFLACERASLEKRKRLGERQTRQASRRLGEVKMQMMKMRSVAEKFKGDNPGEAASVANPNGRASLGY